MDRLEKQILKLGIEQGKFAAKTFNETEVSFQEEGLFPKQIETPGKIKVEIDRRHFLEG